MKFNDKYIYMQLNKNEYIHINQAGGYLENLIICSHFPIKSVMVLFRPKLDWIKFVSCSIFTFLIPSSISIDLFK